MWQPHNLTLPVPSFIEIVSRGSAPTAAPMASFSHCPTLPPVQCLLLLPRWPPSPIVPPSHRLSARCCRPDGLLLPLSHPPTGSMPAAAAPMASFSHCPALPPAQRPLPPLFHRPTLPPAQRLPAVRRGRIQYRLKGTLVHQALQAVRGSVLVQRGKCRGVGLYCQGVHNNGGLGRRHTEGRSSRPPEAVRASDAVEQASKQAAPPPPGSLEERQRVHPPAHLCRGTPPTPTNIHTCAPLKSVIVRP